MCSENGYQREFPHVLSGIRELKDISLSLDRSKKTRHRACGIWGHLTGIHHRQLTYKADLLPSIAGLARACSEILEDTYLAGLWKCHIHFELLWCIYNPDLRSLDALLEARRCPDPYIAPTWSWACHKEYYEYIAPWWTDYGHPAHIRSQLALVDHVVVLESQRNPYGRVKNAVIQLRGKMMPLPSDVKMNSDVEMPWAGMGHLADKWGTVMFDWALPKGTVQKREGMKMLLTASCCQATSNEVMRIYASRDEDHTTTFNETQHKADPDENRGLCEEDADGSEDEEDSLFNCFSCEDETSGANCWGLILYPAETPGAYVRIGVFVLFGGSGGLNRFRDTAYSDVRII